MATPRLPNAISRVGSIMLIALSACVVGNAPPPAAPRPPGAPSVAGHPDMTGWRLLGDAWFTGQFEHGLIRVGKPEGRIARVMLVTMHGNMEVGDVVIQFGNGQRWSPGLRHSFGDGSRSRAIDLPGHVRFIRGVELVHGSVAAGGRAQAEVWGQ
jgi:hypothetical protein